MSRRRPSAAQLPLTPRKKRSAALALVRPITERAMGAGSEMSELSRLSARNPPVLVGTFEPEPKRARGRTALQLARRTKLAELAHTHGPMSSEWEMPRGDLERFAMLSFYEGAVVERLWLSTHESPQAASKVAAEDKLETSFDAVSLFDLDTGDEYRPIMAWELEVGGEE